MKALSKDQKAERDRIIAELEATREKLESEIGAFNDALANQWENVKAALERYNESVAEARGWTEDIAQEIDDFMSEKTEAWMESERGQAYESWKDAFQLAGIEDMDIDPPDELDEQCEDVIEILNSLDEEPAI